METYVPHEKKAVITEKGKRAYRTGPAVGGLLFVKCSDNQLKCIKELIGQRAMFYASPSGVPARIPHREMTIFILVTSTADPGLEYLSENATDYAIGQHVRVTQGVFQGAEGYVRRIRGNRRLVISIQGICAVATSYIPACFLEKID